MSGFINHRNIGGGGSGGANMVLVTVPERIDSYTPINCGQTTSLGMRLIQLSETDSTGAFGVVTVKIVSPSSGYTTGSYQQILRVSPGITTPIFFYHDSMGELADFYFTAGLLYGTFRRPTNAGTVINMAMPCYL